MNYLATPFHSTSSTAASSVDWKHNFSPASAAEAVPGQNIWGSMAPPFPIPPYSP